VTLFVKLCGIRTETDLEAAVESGADAVGFVMTPSPRQVTPSDAARLRALLPSGVLAVAVYHEPAPELVRHVDQEVGPDLHQGVASTLDGVAPRRVLPVVVDGDEVAKRVAEADGFDGMVLVDSRAKGGSGIKPDWGRLAHVASGSKLILAGGLDPGNVAQAIGIVHPFGVDVSSGVERRPGEKDPNLMRAFVDAARDAGQ
jgi:phosphoribosylanthranilate isomerase